MTYWYISFATSKETGGFRGATVVKATSVENALTTATMRGLNPGGEAAILQVPKESETAPELVSMLNRLVGREEMIAQGAERIGDQALPVIDAFTREVKFVCSTCNGPGGCTCH